VDEIDSSAGDLFVAAHEIDLSAGDLFVGADEIDSSAEDRFVVAHEIDSLAGDLVIGADEIEITVAEDDIATRFAEIAGIHVELNSSRFLFMRRRSVVSKA
jgi:hypothetical protein